ncbi:MAG: acetate--CoA ligase family protein [Christensenellales bacterium]|jgi:3-hydroxypropionyl-CoA synthetase (ADP-forming)
MLLNERTLIDIDRIFGNAVAEGRDVLYEYEVYDILNELGLETPCYELVRDVNSVNAELLSRFDCSVIVKVVSADIAHKSKIGGVKKITNLDPLFVRFVLDNMQQEVLSHFPEGAKPAIDGFLIVEHIAFNQGIGSEIMIGISEDETFGPVGTLTKGGDDAEFFAKYYDEPCLFLMPIGDDEARELVHSAKITIKYHQTGKHERPGRIIDAVKKMGRLGYEYSFISQKAPKYHITEMDVNPFVFSDDGRFVAVDGYVRFAEAKNRGIKSPSPPDNSALDAFFKPQGIAVIGVSTDAAKQSAARTIVSLLKDIGRDDVYIVNPKGGSVNIGGSDYKVYKSLEEINLPYELVVYAAPAQHFLEFVKNMPEGKAVILISGIPVDLNYENFATALKEVTPRGVRIMGPNCVGVFYAPDEPGGGVNTIFIDEKKLKYYYSDKSNTALFTQSGGMAINSIDNAGKADIYKVIASIGNKIDVKGTDLISFFADNPAIEVFSLYMEGLFPGEGRIFYELAKRSKKPIIVYKSGRTEAGARAAASHTASMSGSYEVFKAMSEQAGTIVLASDVTEFYNLNKAFPLLAGKKINGSRVAAVTNAGLDATMGADSIGFLQQAVFQPYTIERLKEANTSGLSDITTSFLDLSPMADDIAYGKFVEAVLQDEGVDCVLVGIVPHTANIKTTPDNCRDDDALGPILCNLFNKYNKPMVITLSGSSIYKELRTVFEENRVPVFSNIRSSVMALEAFAKYHLKGR